MPPIVHPSIEAYLAKMTPPRDELFRRLETVAEKEDLPIVGPEEGALLALLVRMTGARRILELGTNIGYSGLWLLSSPQATLTTVERQESFAERARENFRQAKVDSRAQVIIGEVPSILTTLQGSFDLIFQDVDKLQYVPCLPHCLRLLRPGGLLVSDNVLWSGKVAGPEDDPTTQTIRAYNKALTSDPGLTTVLLPLRDGVALTWKHPSAFQE